MESEEFLKPRLVGGRFEGHAIPLEFLRDLAVLNEMIKEGARAEFLKANRNRQRLPKWFAEDFTLVLSDVKDGSAIPVITLLVAMSGFLSNPNQVYFERARDSLVNAVFAASKDQPTDGMLSERSLALFKNFGDRLRDGEAIEFPTGDPESPARFTKEVRRRLLLSLPEVQEVTEEVELRGRVELTNQGEKKFVIRLADGSEVPGMMTNDHYENLIEATTGYRKGFKLYLQGTGVRDRQGKLTRIETIEQSRVLDPLDIHARLDEMRILKDGWLDGQGLAPDSKGIDWLEASARDYYAKTLPLPRIYPAPEGTISLEWSINSKAVSLEIDLGEKSGYWHVLDLDTNQDNDEMLNLADSEGWKVLTNLLAGIQEGPVG